MTPAELQTIQGLFRRYADKIRDHKGQISCVGNSTDPDHLLKLCEEVIQNGGKYPYDKLNRWLGFVQGVLAVYDVIDVKEERDHTRPLFHALYGKEVPTF